MQYSLISSFPNAQEESFEWDDHNRQFREKNVLIHAFANNVAYSEHWGPLSIKTAFNGTEYYKLNNGEFAVNDNNYLVINDGNYYSSYIDSATKVESFTINFSAELINRVSPTPIEFYERLNRHDKTVSPLIFKLKELTAGFQNNIPQIEEIYFLLVDRLIGKQNEHTSEMCYAPAMRLPAKKELYKRLMLAKDFIDSCYTKNITLQELSAICCLNPAYLLRQFHHFFKITPRQYLINKRMEAAAMHLTASTDISITEVCLLVGYSDLASFSKLFKKLYAMSPEMYRNTRSA